MNVSVTGITLQKLNNDLDAGEIIDKGFYSTKFYWLLNREFIYEKSISLFIKNLRLVYENRKINTYPSKILNEKIYRTPKIFVILNYIFKKYPIALFTKISSKKNFTNNNIWKLHISKGNIEDRKLNNLITLQPPNKE